MERQPVYTIACRWSGGVWITTSLMFLLEAGLLLYLLYGLVTGHDVILLLSVAVSAVAIGAVLLFCEGYAPQCVEVGDGSLIVVRRYDNVVIREDDIKELRPLDKQDLRYCLRLWGNGGVFGYTGYFWAPKLGRFSMYATSLSGLTLVRTYSRGTLVVGCSEPELLVKHLKK